MVLDLTVLLPRLDRPRRHRRCLDLLGDFFRLFRLKVHRDLDPVRFDEYPDHALIGRPDLHIRFDVAFAVDTHVSPFDLMGLSYRAAGLIGKGRAGKDVSWNINCAPLIVRMPTG